MGDLEMVGMVQEFALKPFFFFFFVQRTFHLAFQIFSNITFRWCFSTKCISQHATELPWNNSERFGVQNGKSAWWTFF
jgi:hypothetical protein